MYSSALKLPEPEPMATTRPRPQALHHNRFSDKREILNLKIIIYAESDKPLYFNGTTAE